jgi:hypothetical protein
LRGFLRWDAFLFLWARALNALHEPVFQIQRRNCSRRGKRQLISNRLNDPRLVPADPAAEKMLLDAAKIINIQAAEGISG